MAGSRLLEGWRRDRWVGEQLKEVVAVAVGQRGWGFLAERQFVLGNNLRPANAKLRRAHLLDDHDGVGERLGQDQPRLREQTKDDTAPAKARNLAVQRSMVS